MDGLTFRDVDLGYEAADRRPALICDDMHNLKLNVFNAQVAPDASAQMVLRSTTDALITGCRPPATDVFLRIEDGSRLVTALANDLSRVKTPFAFDASTSKSDVYAGFNKMR